jgi:hypothetical protein
VSATYTCPRHGEYVAPTGPPPFPACPSCQPSAEDHDALALHHGVRLLDAEAERLLRIGYATRGSRADGSLELTALGAMAAERAEFSPALPAEMTSKARSEEAITLLERMRDAETDPGGKGFTMGMLDRMRAGEPVDARYLRQLRRAVAKL